MNHVSLLAEDAAILDLFNEQQLEANNVIIGYFGPKDDKFLTFNATALEYDKFTFIYSFNESMREYYKFPKDSHIILWRNFEQKINFYSGELSIP